MKQARAVANYIRVSPRKARGVIDLIRGLGVEEAMDVLELSRKRAAHPLRKLLASAVANATSGERKAERENLFVSRAFVDEGPVLKRFRARAMGRATRILKRTSRITIILEEREAEKAVAVEKKPPRKRGVFARRFGKKSAT